MGYNDFEVCLVKLVVTPKIFYNCEEIMNKKEFAEALSNSERRVSDRKKLIVDVHFSGGDATGIANSRDIGIGGLYMTTNARLDIGTPIFMQMSVSEKVLALNGVVVYSDPGYGVGVRFQDLSESDEGFLKQELNLQ